MNCENNMKPQMQYEKNSEKLLSSVETFATKRLRRNNMDPANAGVNNVQSSSRTWFVSIENENSVDSPHSSYF